MNFLAGKTYYNINSQLIRKCCKACQMNEPQLINDQSATHSISPEIGRLEASQRQPQTHTLKSGTKYSAVQLKSHTSTYALCK